MRRRLFQSLQQGIESLFGKHVRFVNNKDLVTAFQGGIAHSVAQAANIINAPVRRAVDFHHVHKTALRDAAADTAFVAGLSGGGVNAVQRLGENAGHGGFAHPASPAEKIGRGNPVLQRGAGQDGFHHLLPHDLREGLGAVARGKGN